MARFDKELYKVYIIGFIFYLIFCQFGLLSRVTDYLSMFEIIMIPNFLTKLKKSKRKLLASAFIMIFLILFVKDIQSEQINGRYKSTNPFIYPYITIFNKDTLIQYKNISRQQ
ncbi:hypothetical protein FACS1894163_12030 [Spirochaetia bacterium]|nr:hypothetical protein FACS1894163_12030 [Spirochaetia bacterium]